MAGMASRFNTMLSIPMLYCMVAQQNGGLWPHPRLRWTIGAARPRLHSGTSTDLWKVWWLGGALLAASPLG